MTDYWTKYDEYLTPPLKFSIEHFFFFFGESSIEQFEDIYFVFFFGIFFFICYNLFEVFLNCPPNCMLD